MTRKRQENYIVISSAACMLACLGEFLTLFIFGSRYPGYSQLKDTMSALGASASPVSAIMSAWWVMMGILMIFFATGYRMTFSGKGKYAILAALLISLYGFGEGIGSGMFKADHLQTGMTTGAVMHDILGGIGVASILLLPLVMLKVIPKTEDRSFYRMSQIILITGFLTVSLFLFRYSSNENTILSEYKGLWQRLFMLNTYIYLFVVAVIMMRKKIK
jgi:hypothetical protein